MDSKELLPFIRRHWQWWVYPLSFVFFALVAFSLSLPNERIKEIVERELSAEPGVSSFGLGMDVQMEKLSPSLLTGLGATATHVVLRSRSNGSQEDVARYVLDRVRVKVGLWGVMWELPTVHLSVAVDNGRLDGTYNRGRHETLLEGQVKEFSFESLPALKALIGLPTTGILGTKLSLVLPHRPPPAKGLPPQLMHTQPSTDIGKTHGKIEVSIDNWTLGDGKSKFSPTGDPNFGITMPRLRLGKLSGKIAVDKGKAELEQVRTESPDGEAILDGSIELHEPLAGSALHLYLRIKPSESLIKREESMQTLLMMIETAKRGDGYYGVQVTGTLGAPIFLASRIEPMGVQLGGAARAAAPAPRPVLPSPPSVHIPSIPLPAPPSVSPPAVTEEPRERERERDREREVQAPPLPPPREAATPPTIEVPHVDPGHVPGALHGESPIGEKKEEAEEPAKEPDKEKAPAGEAQ